MKKNMLSWLLILALGMMLTFGESAGWAQVPSADDLVVKAGGGRSVYTVAVPEFEGAVLQGNQASLAKIVLRDLELSGFFRPPQNPQFAADAQKLDQARGTIQFAEWYRAGVYYVVKGVLKVEGEKLTAEVKVYDTTSGAYISGRRYLDYTVAQVRPLGHRISNDIISKVLGEDGFAGSQILFVRKQDRMGKSKQVCVMDSDGYGVRSLTPGGELTATPCWGARGTEVYYTTYRDYNPDLAGMILSKGTGWWISRKGGFNLSPAWNERRELIAMTMTKDGNSELYTLKRDGTELKRLTINRAIDSSPCWSPDGTQMVFTSDRTGSPHIYVMDLRTGETRRLTYHANYNDAAVWSPRPGDDRIAFCSRIDGDFQIFTIKSDGTELLQLTKSDNNEDPTWAPNGLSLAFTSDRRGIRQIYTMFADGSNVQQITHESSDCQSAAWSPLVP